MVDNEIPLLKESDLSILFGTIKSIYKTTQHLLNDLTNGYKQWPSIPFKIGSIFLQLVCYFYFNIK